MAIECHDFFFVAMQVVKVALVIMGLSFRKSLDVTNWTLKESEESPMDIL